MQKYQYLATERLTQDRTNKLHSETLEYRLKAADYFIKAGKNNKATQLLNSLEKTTLQQDAYRYILKTEIALTRPLTIEACETLRNIMHPRYLPNELLAKFYQIRAAISIRTGNAIEASKDHILLEELLLSKDEKKNNNKTILNILSQLTPNVLHALELQELNPTLTGWLNLVHITKQYDTSSAQITRALEIWNRRYPNHPAHNILHMRNIACLHSERKVPQKRIALLLPLKGPYSTSAQAIKNGFLAAYYQSSSESNNSEIRVYDTTKQGGVLQAYKFAIHNKSNFIVGPLIKENIEKLARLPKLQVPILTLNTISNSTEKKHPNLFQFGLPPEAEAITVAEKAWLDGYRNALVIGSNSEWSHRVTKTFQKSWKQHGANILAIETVSEKKDFNSNIRKLLGIDSSDKRANNLKSLGLKFNHEPRRRQDADIVFFAINSTLARQLKPLLNYYYSDNLPVYACSSIYSGQKSTIQNQDLNGVKFCDMPWILDNTIASRSIYRNIAKLWCNHLEQSPRLYAFGIDAYKISQQLNQLSFQEFGISGMTGILKISPQQRIYRELTWATFQHGIPVLLTERSG